MICWDCLRGNILIVSSKDLNMHTCSPGDAHNIKGDKYSKLQCPKDELEKEAMKQIAFVSVGSLMYGQVCSRPDIAYAIGLLARLQSKPRMNHLEISKKVMRCL